VSIADKGCISFVVSFMTSYMGADERRASRR
jgi:hypothetical protein